MTDIDRGVTGNFIDSMKLINYLSLHNQTIYLQTLTFLQPVRVQSSLSVVVDASPSR